MARPRRQEPLSLLIPVARVHVQDLMPRIIDWPGPGRLSFMTNRNKTIIMSFDFDPRAWKGHNPLYNRAWVRYGRDGVTERVLMR
jgi:hypothetical protein